MFKETVTDNSYELKETVTDSLSSFGAKVSVSTYILVIQVKEKSCKQPLESVKLERTKSERSQVDVHKQTLERVKHLNLTKPN